MTRSASLLCLWAIPIVAAATGCSSSNSGTSPTPPSALVGTVLTARASEVTAGCFSRIVPDTPVVVLRDSSGAVVAGATVNFAVLTGGGGLSATTRTTDAQGRAGVAWTLGAGGTQTVSASTGTLTPVTFSATGTGSGPFCIELIYTATPDPLLRVAVDSAARRWSRIVTGSLSTELITQTNLTCANITGLSLVNRSISSLLIFMQLAPIVSPTPGLVTLGSAGPCLVRTSNGLPVVGGMRLNSDYLLNNLGVNQRTDVVLHEMGHTLGFGTNWTGIPGIPALPVLLSGATSTSRTGNPVFTGASALAQYLALGATGSPTSVPVENCGGGGTLNGHWREDAVGSGGGFGTELMTGFISAPVGQRNPLSKLTIASLKDMGYVVDSTQADPYTLNSQTCPAPLLFAPGSVVVGTDVVSEELATPTHMVRGGRVEPIFRK